MRRKWPRRWASAHAEDSSTRYLQSVLTIFLHVVDRANSCMRCLRRNPLTPPLEDKRNIIVGQGRGLESNQERYLVLGRPSILQQRRLLLTNPAKTSRRITTTLAIRLQSTTRRATKHALERRSEQSDCVAESTVHARRSITGNFVLAIFTVIRH